MSGEIEQHRYLLEIGISKARGLSAYTSLSQIHTLSFYSRENGPLRQTPKSVAEYVEERRAYETERRLLVLIVEGSLEYLKSFKNSPIRADVRIFVGNLSDLEILRIRVIDKHWEQGSQQLNLNDFVRPFFRN